MNAEKILCLIFGGVLFFVFCFTTLSSDEGWRNGSGRFSFPALGAIGTAMIMRGFGIL